MPLTDQDKIECREIGRIIVQEVLTDHIANCPHHQSYLVSKARAFGVVCGIIVASGVTSGTVVTIIMKLFGGT